MYVHRTLKLLVDLTATLIVAIGSLVSSLTGPPTAGVESGATTIITEEPNKTLLASDDVLD